MPVATPNSDGTLLPAQDSAFRRKRGFNQLETWTELKLRVFSTNLFTHAREGPCASPQSGTTACCRQYQVTAVNAELIKDLQDAIGHGSSE
jgi:hypothetical protein